MSVEFIIAAPMLVMLLLLIAFAGQWFNNTNQVGAAARDAARTAANIVHHRLGRAERPRRRPRRR